ncbi:MAG TPA: RNA 2',3'-cyclic phosphodiesterase [Thermoleophilaceae bacterium]
MGKSSRSEPRPSGRPGSPRARLFLALEPREEDRAALGDWRDALVAGRDDLRPTAAATLHLTLAFLGYRPEKEIPAIARAAFEAIGGAGPALLVPEEVVGVPPRGPRLFALDLADDGGRAGRVQEAASRALADRGFYTPEKRAWWPHVTLARVKRGRRAEPLRDPPERALPPDIRAPLVTLYRSILRPQGALYEPLERIELKHG